MPGMLVVLIIASLLAGCIHEGPPKKSKPKPPLTEQEVLKRADKFAKNRQGKDDAFDLKHYPNRRAEFDPERNTWRVLYVREPNRWPGDYFMIFVEGTTGTMDYLTPH